MDPVAHPVKFWFVGSIGYCALSSHPEGPGGPPSQILICWECTILCVIITSRRTRWPTQSNFDLWGVNDIVRYHHTQKYPVSHPVKFWFVGSVRYCALSSHPEVPDGPPSQILICGEYMILCVIITSRRTRWPTQSNFDLWGVYDIVRYHHIQKDPVAHPVKFWFVGSVWYCALSSHPEGPGGPPSQILICGEYMILCVIITSRRTQWPTQSHIWVNLWETETTLSSLWMQYNCTYPD